MKPKANPSRRLATLLMALALTGALAFTAIGYSLNNHAGEKSNGMVNRPVLSVDSLGNPSTVALAAKEFGVTTSPPTDLPVGMTLVGVRASADAVALVYFDKETAQIPFYNNATMIVLIMNDGTSASSPVGSTSPGSAFVSQNGSNVTVSMPVYSLTNPAVSLSISGHVGWGTNQTSWDVSRVSWWANGLHYEVLANLPLAVLINVANSMNS